MCELSDKKVRVNDHLQVTGEIGDNGEVYEGGEEEEEMDNVSEL